ncbi:hypothetical protein GOC94_10085 [Sinorhizobium medicae]|nr:hypothetical protein [Sinorhizobium medicae]
MAVPSKRKPSLQSSRAVSREIRNFNGDATNPPRTPAIINIRESTAVILHPRGRRQIYRVPSGGSAFSRWFEYRLVTAGSRLSDFDEGEWLHPRLSPPTAHASNSEQNQRSPYWGLIFVGE